MSITLGFLQTDADRQLETAAGLVEVLTDIRSLAAQAKDEQQREMLSRVADRLARDADRLVRNASDLGRAIGELSRGTA